MGLIYLTPELEKVFVARRAVAIIGGRDLKAATDRWASKAGAVWTPLPGAAGIPLRRTDGTLVVGRTEMLVPVAAVAGADDPTEWPAGGAVTPVSWGTRLSRWAVRTRNWRLLDLLRAGDDLAWRAESFWRFDLRHRREDLGRDLKYWWSDMELRLSTIGFRLGQLRDWLCQPIGGDRWRWGDSHEESKGLALWLETIRWEIASFFFWSGLISVGIFMILTGVILLITLAGILGWSVGLEGLLAIALVSLLVLTGAFAILAMALTFAIELIAAAVDWVGDLPRWVWLTLALLALLFLGGSVRVDQATAPANLDRPARPVWAAPYPLAGGCCLPTAETSSPVVESIGFAAEDLIEPYPGFDENYFVCCQGLIVVPGDTIYGTLWTAWDRPPSAEEISEVLRFNGLKRLHLQAPTAPEYSTIVLIYPGDKIFLPSLIGREGN